MEVSDQQRGHEYAMAIIEGATRRIENKFDIQRFQGEKLAEFCERVIDAELNKAENK